MKQPDSMIGKRVRVVDNGTVRYGTIAALLSREETSKCLMPGQLITAIMDDTRKAEKFSYGWEIEGGFDQRCKDFDLRRPSGPPIKRTFWFEAKLEGDNSVNGVLRRYLRNNALEYLNTMNGDVWFLWEGNWCRCDFETSDGIVRYYLCEFLQESEKGADEDGV